ncbi:MAG: PQQ-binding-like beta-propeller repeat protein [Planctomycetaceae bacterium]|nr:PQQ-binding-like beta-propeller repeat protein [Planctomycetaceae bacterium]
MTTVLDATTVPGVRTLYRIAVILAAVSGAFCILFCMLLAINYHGLLAPSGTMSEVPPSSDPSYRLTATDSFNRLPTDYHSFLDRRHQLAEDRQNDELRTQIRELDEHLRTSYFQRRITIHRSALLLIVSSILFFVAMSTIGVLKRRLPDPGNFKTQKNKQTEPKGTWQFAVVSSWLMLFAGLYVGLWLAPLPQMEQIFSAKLVADADTTVLSGVPAKSQAVSESAVPSVSSVKLTEEILAQHWVSFRNFDGNGIGVSGNPPIHWDGTTGENIIWKSEVPLPGASSPVIWGDKLFLTGADEETEKIFCYNITNGELLWTANVTRPEAKLPQEPDHDTGYAAPTPVVDGERVYAMFANGELVAVDFAGNLVWRHSFGTPDNSYGFASSPALYFDRLIVQFDDGDGSEGNSKLFAFALETGKVLWETPRDLPCSWASPTIKKIGDAYQIITCANPFVVAYNPDNGEEVWRVKCLTGDVGPSAFARGNIVVITNDSPRTTAIDATGTGDITATHIRWTGSGATPHAPSPVATEKYVLTLSDGGWLSGYDPTMVDLRTPPRARYWELEVGDLASFYSSPLLVGTYVYIFAKTEVNESRGTQPKAFVIDLSKVVVNENGELTDESAAAMIIAENPMPEPIVASPALLNNRIYIRGDTMLFCIGEN